MRLLPCLLVGLLAAGARAGVPVSEAVPESASLPGLLTISGQHHQAPTHGGLSELGIATYRLHNESDHPLVVDVSDLIAKSEQETLPLAISAIFAGDIEAAAKKGLDRLPGHRIDLAPRQTLAVAIDAPHGIAKAHFHQLYHHECRFVVDGRAIVVRAGGLWFRRPHSPPWHRR